MTRRAGRWAVTFDRNGAAPDAQHMTRTRPAVLATAALALAGILAACGGAPAATRLDDPTAVLEAAVSNAASASSVRIDGTDLRRLTNNDYCDYQPRWGP